MDTPVALIVFNRPAHTARVFEAVRAARPRTLFVVADGPRPDRPADAEACRAVRALIDRIDWPCDLVRIYSEENLGCRVRVGGGITEVFRHVESCIILEDDCLPDQTFFPYCRELLERYADRPEVMVVSGCGLTNALGGLTFPASYYFTRYVHIWGWATWRRAWAHFDGQMRQWPALKEQGFPGREIGSFQDRLFWRLWFQMCHDGRLNTWDIAWVMNCWAAGGLAICPDRNLVSNIGIDGSGTNFNRRSPFASVPTRSMDFPLAHPAEIRPDRAADRWTQKFCFTGPPRRRFKRFMRYLKHGDMAIA